MAAVVEFGLSNRSEKTIAPVILTVSTAPATKAAMEEINSLYRQQTAHVTLPLTLACPSTPSSTDAPKQIEQGIPTRVIIRFRQR